MNYKNRFVFIFVIAFAFVFLLVFWDFISSSGWFVRVFGVKSNRILNGREYDIQLSFSYRGFIPFLFGSGVGSAYLYGGTEYIHNLFGQLYYEQGIILTIFVLVVIIKAIAFIFKKQRINNNEKKYIMSVFLCCSIVRLMVSYYFWIDANFWLFLFTTINLTFGKNKSVMHIKSVKSRGNINGKCYYSNL